MKDLEFHIGEIVVCIENENTPLVVGKDYIVKVIHGQLIEVDGLPNYFRNSRFEKKKKGILKPLELDYSDDQKIANCTHDWLVTQGLFTTWKDCKKCGVKHEELDKYKKKSYDKLPPIPARWFDNDPPF